MKCKDGWVLFDNEGDGTVIFQFPDGMTLVTPLALVRKKDRPFLWKRIRYGGGWTGPAYAFECRIDDAGFIAAVSKRIPVGAVFPDKSKRQKTKFMRMHT